ncbi:MAG: hypothetical protein ABIQ11_03245 [Saprospiraceae bacterium]
MKQSPFKFQGNNTVKAKKAKNEEAKTAGDLSNKPIGTPKSSKRISTRSYAAPVRSGRSGNIQGTKAKG